MLAAARPVVFGSVLLIRVRMTSGFAHPWVSPAQSPIVVKLEQATGVAQTTWSPRQEDTSAAPSMNIHFTALTPEPAIDPTLELSIRKRTAQNVPLTFIEHNYLSGMAFFR